MELINLLPQLGIPLFILIAVGWWFKTDFWQYMKSRIDILYAAIDNNTKALLLINSAISAITTKLEQHTTTLEQLEDELDVISTVLEIRHDMIRPTVKKEQK